MTVWYHKGNDPQLRTDGVVHLGSARAAFDRRTFSRDTYEVTIAPQQPFNDPEHPMVDAWVNLIGIYRTKRDELGRDPTLEETGETGYNAEVIQEIMDGEYYGVTDEHDAFYYSNDEEDRYSISVMVSPSAIVSAVRVDLDTSGFQSDPKLPRK